jgi:hypothetical protein
MSLLGEPSSKFSYRSKIVAELRAEFSHRHGSIESGLRELIVFSHSTGSANPGDSNLSSGFLTESLLDDHVAPARKATG